MNNKPDLLELTALCAIVAHRSFRQAADELDLAPSTLSHMIRALEARLGVRLLNRTTRSVSPTEAGGRLVTSLQPVLRDLDLALGAVDVFRSSPSGTLRLNASETAARLLMKAVVPAFLKRCPEMALDLVTDGELIDIVAEGFDAGIRLGEALPQDMISVRFGGPVRFMAVAAPDYLSSHAPLKTPDDLKHHDCIRVRMPSGKLYRWEFARRGQELVIDTAGRLTLDHIGLMVQAAADGLGIAFVPDRAAQPWLDDGRLVAVLADWCPAMPGLFLYYPGGRLVPAGLRAFIDVLREQGDLAPEVPDARSAKQRAKPKAQTKTRTKLPAPLLA